MQSSKQISKFQCKVVVFWFCFFKCLQLKYVCKLIAVTAFSRLKKSFGATLKMEKCIKTAQEVQTDNWKFKSYM